MTTLPIPPRSLVVSCQARPGAELRGPEAMALMARAAIAGGASAIRANGPADVAAVHRAVDVPIIGINKLGDRDGVYITPSVEAAAAVVEAGAALVAIDGTSRVRPDGMSLTDQIQGIRAQLRVPVMADVDTVASGLAACVAGADVIATTLSGYTSNGPTPDGPDIDLVAALATSVDCPVIAEGRYWTPEHVAAAFQAGAHAVVVGTAITDPAAITRRLRHGIDGVRS